MNDIAIQVSNLSKCYQIYDSPRDRLKQFVAPRLCTALPALRRYFPTPDAPVPTFYREFWALKDVSFEVKKGETVGIIGRNGSGKSTLLQLICGTLSPTAGSVETQGRIAALLELGAGFNPDFTGRENVFMNAAVLGLSRQEVQERFDDIAAFADIGQFIEQPVKTYSSGMYVRLAFAVNAMATPEIMIVDEALAVGDMAFQAKCMTALTRMQDRGTTVLFVSHDISALKSLCSRGVLLENGETQGIGPAGQVAERYIRKMREEMNAEAASSVLPANTKASTTSQLKNQARDNAPEFKASPVFEKQVAHFRYGDGGAKITFAQLLDTDFQPVNEVKFDQPVFVRVYFEASTNSELISCNYYILDDKRNVILGADVGLGGGDHICIENSGKYVVTFRTRLPLQEGNYSVQLEITESVDDNSSKFLDVIDNAIIFKMFRREVYRLWAKVFIENQVEVEECRHD